MLSLGSGNRGPRLELCPPGAQSSSEGSRAGRATVNRAVTGKIIRTEEALTQPGHRKFSQPEGTELNPRHRKKSIKGTKRVKGWQYKVVPWLDMLKTGSRKSAR